MSIEKLNFSRIFITNLCRSLFGRLITNLSNTIVFDSHVRRLYFFTFFFFGVVCHSLALNNDKQIAFLCQPIPRHTPHTQWLIISGGKINNFRN